MNETPPRRRKTDRGLMTLLATKYDIPKVTLASMVAGFFMMAAVIAYGQLEDNRRDEELKTSIAVAVHEGRCNNNHHNEQAAIAHNQTYDPPAPLPTNCDKGPPAAEDKRKPDWGWFLLGAITTAGFSWAAWMVSAGRRENAE